MSLVATGVGLGTSALNGLMGGVFDSILGNVGSVFANGFDLSCWGSSASPSKAKAETPNDLKDLMEASGIGSTINETTFNKFVEYMHFFAEAKRWHAGNSSASCSKKGNNLSADMAQAVLSETLQSLQSAYNISQRGTKTLQKGFKFNYKWRNANLDLRKDITVPVYSVRPKQQTSGTYENQNPDTPTQAGSGGLFKVLGLGVLASWLAGKL